MIPPFCYSEFKTINYFRNWCILIYHFWCISIYRLQQVLERVTTPRKPLKPLLTIPRVVASGFQVSPHNDSIIYSVYSISIPEIESISLNKSMKFLKVLGSTFCLIIFENSFLRLSLIPNIP